MLKEKGDGPQPDFKNPHSPVNTTNNPRRLIIRVIPERYNPPEEVPT